MDFAAYKKFLLEANNELLTKWDFKVAIQHVYICLSNEIKELVEASTEEEQLLELGDVLAYVVLGIELLKWNIPNEDVPPRKAIQCIIRGDEGKDYHGALLHYFGEVFTKITEESVFEEVMKANYDKLKARLEKYGSFRKN